MEKRKTKYPMPSKMDQFRRRHRTAYSGIKMSLLALAVALPVYLFAGKFIGLQITDATNWLTKQPGMVDVMFGAFMIVVLVALLSIYRIIAMTFGKVYVLLPNARSYEHEEFVGFDVNPATGLPIGVAGVDISGYPYGVGPESDDD